MADLEFHDLEDEDPELIERAARLLAVAGDTSTSVGCALRTEDGEVFTGVNVQAPFSEPCSTCAEYPAVAAMVADGEHRIQTVVAVSRRHGVIPPCGRCRELMRRFGDPWVVVQHEGRKARVRLGELLPLWGRSDPA